MGRLNLWLFPTLRPSCATSLLHSHLGCSKGKLLIFTRVSAIVTDGLVLAVTWLETFSSWQASKNAGLKTSLATLLLRDGTAYFLILFTLNIIHLVCTLTGVFTTSVGTFVESLTTILTSRFILNLRGFNRSGYRSPLESRSSIGRWSRQSFPVVVPGDGLDGISSRFSGFVAPLGAPLNSFCSLETAEGEGGDVEIDSRTSSALNKREADTVYC
ncbi:hypothetical protein C8Q80DRAFT_757828 [Daedaleopsis nitida]|nr:hypothetical protein C8Q80DRAFT_757828 [Daedaleopsis nitida]